MSGILPAKEIRHRFKAAIAAAGIDVEINGAPVAVDVLDRAPVGWTIKDESLPALYVFTTGEGLTHESLSEVERMLSLDVALMARSGGDPMDQLDDMQLAVERAVLDAGGLGLARSVRLMALEIAQDQGALMLGVRVMKYVITYGTTPDDPSL